MNNFRISNKLITTIIYLYIALPFIVFVLFWLRPVLAVVLGALTLFGLFLAIKKDRFLYRVEDISRRNYVMPCACAIIAIWVLASGIGGYAFQNTDFNCRNAIFRALVEYRWPVLSYDGTRGLNYYIGFWLPSALVGKVFGYSAGTAATYIWAMLGVIIVFYLLCVWRKKYSLWPILILIFFGGLDYLGMLILGTEGTAVFDVQHLEWWATYFQYSSMTTQLFWVFNQAIPSWVVTMLLITNGKNKRNVLFIMSFLILSSTFPFAGLIPFVIYYLLKEFKLDKDSIREIFSLQNIIGVVIVGGTSIVYIFGNNAIAAKISLTPKLIIVGLIGGVVGIVILLIGYYLRDFIKKFLYTPAGVIILATVTFLLCLRWVTRGGDYVASPLQYILFYMFEFGIYLVFAYKYCAKRIEYYIALVVLIACPYMIVGNSFDFCMRASIPALLYTMLFSIKSIEAMINENRRAVASVFIAILMIASVTSLHEINRSIRNTMTLPKQGLPYTMEEVPIETDILGAFNFSADTSRGIFYKYFAKQ